MNLILALVLIWLSLSLGVILGSALRLRRKYNGVINVYRTPDKTTYQIELNHPTDVLETVKEVRFKIRLPEDDIA